MKPLSSLIYLAFILLVISVSACKPETYPSSETSILDNPICSPPCWQNIIPGETNRNDLLTALAGIDNFDQSSLVQRDYPNKKDYNQVVYGKLYLEPNAVTFVSAYLSDETVVELNFTGLWNLTLEEVIEEFGEPEGVFIYHSNDFNVVSFLIPSKGVAFRFDIPRGPVDSIVPEMEIKDIDYFSPNYYYELLEMGWFSEGKWDYQESIARIKPWKGYGDINELYR
jgi:hypothetical protein